MSELFLMKELLSRKHSFSRRDSGVDVNFVLLFDLDIFRNIIGDWKYIERVMQPDKAHR